MRELTPPHRGDLEGGLPGMGEDCKRRSLMAGVREPREGSASGCSLRPLPGGRCAGHRGCAARAECAGHGVCGLPDAARGGGTRVQKHVLAYGFGRVDCAWPAGWAPRQGWGCGRRMPPVTLTRRRPHLRPGLGHVPPSEYHRRQARKHAAPSFTRRLLPVAVQGHSASCA